MAERSCGIAAMRPGAAATIDATFWISLVIVARLCAATANRGPAPATDVVMLVNSEPGAKKLLESKFTLGGDASVAGGPVGRTSSAETDAQLHAEILTYSRSRGLFAGISLQGATLRPDEDWNKDLYGSALTNKEIVLGGTPPPPAAAKLLAVLNKYSSRK